MAGIIHKTDAFLYATTLDAPISTDEDAYAAVNFLPDPCDGTEEIILRELLITQLHEKLENALNTLSDDQNEVLHRRYLNHIVLNQTRPKPLSISILLHLSRNLLEKILHSPFDTYCMLTYCLKQDILNLRWCIYAIAPDFFK